MRNIIFTCLCLLLCYSNAQAQYFFLSPKIVNNKYIGTLPYQGASIKVSGDGNTMMIGATLDSAKRGSVYVYKKLNNAWVEDTVLTPVGHTPYQFSQSFYMYGFGSAITMSYDGNTAIISRAGDNSTGAVWVWERDANGKWSNPGGRLGIPSPFPDNINATFGLHMSLSSDGSRGVISAPNWKNLAGNSYTINRVSAGVYNIYELVQGCRGDVAISGNGERIVYIGPNNYWHYMDYSPTSGWVYKGFIPYTPQSIIIGGFDLSYSGDTIALGVNFGVNLPGAVTLAYANNTWTQFGGDIKVSNSAVAGMQVDITPDGKKIAMGMRYENNSVGGASYTELDANGQWKPVLRLTNNGGIGQAQLGSSLSMSDDGSVIAVGASNDNNRIGAAYVNMRGIPQLTPLAINGSPFCQNTSYNIAIPFTSNILGANFTAQLSDANGDFLNPVTLGVGNTSPINGNISPNTPKGSGYRIRLLYTGGGNLNLDYTGDTTSQPIEINTCQLQSVTGLAASKIKVYPNPASSVLHVDGLEQATDYRIINSVGMTLQSGQVNKGSGNIQLNIPTGVYFIELKDKSTVIATLRILIQ